MSGAIVDSYMYLSTKIGIDSLDVFLENAFYGRTDANDRDLRHGISSDTVEQS